MTIILWILRTNAVFLERKVRNRKRSLENTNSRFIVNSRRDLSVIRNANLYNQTNVCDQIFAEEWPLKRTDPSLTDEHFK
jgi:hypothetical protein